MEREDNILIWYNLSSLWQLNERDSATLKSDSLACKQCKATPISNHYTSSGRLWENVPVSLNIRRPASASSASNEDITDVMQHMEMSKGRALVSASSWISGDERDNYSDKPSVKRAILRSHNKKREKAAVYWPCMGGIRTKTAGFKATRSTICKWLSHILNQSDVINLVPGVSYYFTDLEVVVTYQKGINKTARAVKKKTTSK